ncbi:MAG: sel1 repeat family protein [Parachlamydiaceae bacterium]|nr:sel1 repeat family protein [Parachlamydiaceae bacterium]
MTGIMDLQPEKFSRLLSELAHNHYDNITFDGREYRGGNFGSGAVVSLMTLVEAASKYLSNQNVATETKEKILSDLHKVIAYQKGGTGFWNRLDNWVLGIDIDRTWNESLFVLYKGESTYTVRKAENAWIELSKQLFNELPAIEKNDNIVVKKRLLTKNVSKKDLSKKEYEMGKIFAERAVHAPDKITRDKLYDEALRCFEFAKERGNVEAHGSYIFEGEKQHGFEWEPTYWNMNDFTWREAAKAGNKECRVKIGLGMILRKERSYDKRDTNRIVGWMNDLSKDGYNDAKAVLGYLYLTGERGVEKNIELGNQLLSESMVQESDWGFLLSAELEENLDDKIELLEVAAVRNPIAQFRLGEIYIKLYNEEAGYSDHFVDDHAQKIGQKAIKLLEQSAKKGYPPAMAMVVSESYSIFKSNLEK